MVHDLGFWVLFSSLASITVASNDCAPSTWQPGQFKRDVTSISSRLTSSTGTSTVLSSSTVTTSTHPPAVTTVIISPLVSSGNVGVGQVNCRYAANTEGMSINYYTCTELAQNYGINVETFFKLNPTVLPDCSNIKADTDYCVAGYPDSYCLCNNVNFGYGLRDCANGACGTAVGSTVIAYGSAYCSTAFATHTVTSTGFAALPSCGQTCFNNMKAQYSTLGCSSPDPPCLCKNANFGYGLRDCANGACGTAVASTVVAYGSSYCASATTTKA
ncbi:hypothetical protein MBLNU13_g02054t2 [Cladosporium sp. NU13]